jgi:CO/xanthine dehydrogenase FAD-binding subunit
MKRMRIEQPASLADAAALLAEHGSRALCVAGATDVIISWRKGELPEAAELLVDISGLKELRGIRESEGQIIIGSGTTHAEAESDPLLLSTVPFLCEAAASVGSPQIRNRGTIGGNIVTSAQCADTIPPLLVLDAEAVLVSAAGERTVALSDFLIGPKQTAIRPEEIMREIRFTRPPEGARGAFVKLIRREAVAKARISLALLAAADSAGKLTDCRFSPGSVTPQPQRFSEVERLLCSRVPDEQLIEEAAELTAAVMIRESGRRWSAPYKEPVLKTLTSRLLRRILMAEEA